MTWERKRSGGVENSDWRAHRWVQRSGGIRALVWWCLVVEAFRSMTGVNRKNTPTLIEGLKIRRGRRFLGIDSQIAAEGLGGWGGGANSPTSMSHLTTSPPQREGRGGSPHTHGVERRMRRSSEGVGRAWSEPEGDVGAHGGGGLEVSGAGAEQRRCLGGGSAGEAPIDDSVRQ